MPFSGQVLEGFVFKIYHLVPGRMVPPQLLCCPQREKLLGFTGSSPLCLVRTCGAGYVPRPVALSGTLCLELVSIVLIRQLLSENGSLSNLKLFMGREQFQ